MSTYADGTQQTYQQIWAGMERSCALLMAAVQTDGTEAERLEVVVIGGRRAAIEWPVGRGCRKHSVRRSARRRRRIAARAR